MSWPVQDLVDAFLTAARAASGSPSLVVHDGVVPTGGLPPYALVYFHIQTPDGTVAPDAISLTLASSAIDARAYVHCVGANAVAARAVSGRVRNAVLDLTLTVTGRSCFPVRWLEGQPPQRNEDVPGTTVFDQVDVYGWRSVPA